MTKAGEKLIAAAEQMVAACWCNHELVYLRRLNTTAPQRFDRLSCKKCGTVFYVPIAYRS
jgi:uncharacterized OB-fold protein